MSSRRRLLALGGVLIVLAAGCDHPPPAEPGPTTSSAAPPPSTSESATTAPPVTADPAWSLDKYVGDRGAYLAAAGNAFLLNVPYAEYDEKLGWLYGITGEGAESWKLEFTSDFRVTIAGDVAIVSYDHPTDDRWPRPQVLKAIDTATGATLWEDDQSSFHTVFQETVYTTTCNGLQDGGYDNCVLASRDPRTGEVHWTTPTEAAASVETSYLDRGFQAAPEPPFIALRAYPTGFDSELIRTLDPVNGHWLAAVDHDPHRIMIASDTLVRTTADRDEEPLDGCTSALQGIDVHSGSLSWERTVEVPLEPGGTYCLDLWPEHAGTDVLPVLAGDLPQLLDLTTGEPRWPALPSGYVLAGDDRVLLVGTGEESASLTLYDAATGAPRWTVPNPYLGSTAVIRGDRLILRSDSCLASDDQCSDAHVLDLATGTEIISAPGDYAGAGPDWFATADSLPGESGMTRIRLYSTA